VDTSPLVAAVLVDETGGREELSSLRRRVHHNMLYSLGGFLVLVVVAVIVAVVMVTKDESSSAGRPKPTDFRYFETTHELRAAVDSYLIDSGSDSTGTTAKTYGWPIGSWNVSNRRKIRKISSSCLLSLLLSCLASPAANKEAYCKKLKRT
jgi:hypothetical protein